MSIIQEAPMLAFKNKDKLGTVCACYSCLKFFGSCEIEEWTDDGKTAICPHCGVDSLLPEDSIGGMERYPLIDENNPHPILVQIKNYWIPQGQPVLRSEDVVEEKGSQEEPNDSIPEWP